MKKIIITEEQKNSLLQRLCVESAEVQQMPVSKDSNKPYTISPNKVLIVKKFLDNNFKKGNLENIGNDGLKQTIPIVSIMSSTGESLKNLYKEDLLDLLIEKFKKMFLDTTERKLFLKQVMEDWFNDKITPLGMLSVNFVKENKNNINEITAKEIDDRTKNININPTEKQKEAGNYAKAHISIMGMKIAIEQPKGSKRYYYEDGEQKYNVMKNHYGYFNATRGKDNDQVDVFIGPNVDNFKYVYCVDQNNKHGEFDETKVMLGFNSKDEAKQAYLANYSPNWKGFRSITAVSLKTFKKWLYRGRKQRIPFSKYVEIKKAKVKNS